MDRENASRQAVSDVQAGLVRKARMAAVGEFASAVSHEIGNFLGTLATCIQLLRKSPQLTQECGEILDLLHAGSERLKEFAWDLSMLGRPRPLQLQEVNLHELINETLTRMQRESRLLPSITICREFDSTVQQVRADPEQLQQTFWELFTNAVQAMGEEGELRVTTQQAGDQLRIEVHDSGPGIPPALLPNIFDPFCSTKPGETGLGLAIVQRIVEEHGGQIAVDSKCESGACFVLTFPTPEGKASDQQSNRQG